MNQQRIMIVDDEIIIARELETRLLKMGYEVTGLAASGPEAVELASETQPNLVLMDINLKGDMDGIEAATHIRDSHSIPIIYLTAFTDERTLERAKLTEPYGYVVKPFTEPELRANIEMALYKHGELQASLGRILEASLNEIYIFDAESLEFIVVNRGARENLGYTMDELRHLTPPDLKPGYTRETFAALVEPLRDGKQGIVVFEARHRRKDGSDYDVEVHLQMSRFQGRACFVAIILDITDRNAAEESLRREHELSESMVNTAQNIVLVLDTKGRVVRFNPYMEELTGWRLEEVRGRDWFDTFLPEHNRQRTRDLFGRAIGGERTRGTVNAILTKDRHEREIEWYDAPLTCAEGELIGLLCTGLDVTERRKLEREILDIAAEEQRRVGHELHDSTQQQLTGLGLLAQNVAEGLEELSTSQTEPGLLDCIAGLHQTATKVEKGLEHAAREVNQLSRGLNPVDLDSQGLMSSLTELARSVSEVQKVTCTFNCEAPIKVADNSTATHLYRITQEAVNNALKHSRGDRIEIRLADVNGVITLRVLDNGSGIDKQCTNGPGTGLRIMAYRADLIGATLNVGQANGQGTELTCTVAPRMQMQ